MGWQEHSPYDAIIVTCAPKEVPLTLIKQLKDGGRLVVPVGEYFQELKLIRKEDGKIIKLTYVFEIDSATPSGDYPFTLLIKWYQEGVQYPFTQSIRFFVTISYKSN